MSVDGKMRPVEHFPTMGAGRIKENSGGVQFNCDVFDIIKKTL
jgi:hypothetical protein